MVTLRAAASLAASFTVVLAQSSGRQGYGMVGHGIDMYQPECAHACRGASPRAAIDCGDGQEHAPGHHGGVRVSPECMAVNEPWLKTVAYCIHDKCRGIDNSTLERYWQMDLINRHGQPLAKWSYQEALHRVFDEGIPTEVLDLEKEALLNRTVLVDEEAYLANANGNTGFENSERWHVNWGLIILLTGAGIPILCSLLRFAPFPKSAVSKFNAYVVEPPLMGTKHNVPILRNMAVMPTRGQALFLLYIFVINIVSSFAMLDLRTPNAWWSSEEHEFLVIYSNRVGVLSFANLPLLFLYAGRNNVLLWVTNWSHSTFLLLHRWVGFICMAEAVIHSAVFLDVHLRIYQDHSEVVHVEYWYWGIIATLALVLLIPFSILPLRQRLYEFFHASHIVLSILAIVGCWQHIIWRYERQWGYEVWVLVAIGVWVFDWLVRGLRLARNRVKRAYVTKIDEDYLRVDIPGLDSHGHVYLYFPTLNWRLWESHPFSVIGSLTAGVTNPEPAPQTAASANDSSEKPAPNGSDVGKGTVAAASSTSLTGSSSSSGLSAAPGSHPVGTTLYIRLMKGTTQPLARQAGSTTGLPVLVESSYGHEPGGAHVRPSTSYPNLIAVAGGIGITAVLPILSRAQSLYAPVPGSEKKKKKKLFWGVREGSEALVDSVQSVVVAGSSSEKGTSAAGQAAAVPGRNVRRWGDVDVDISVGERFDLRAVLEAEIGSGEDAKVGTTVLVCGPVGMADDVRNVVTALARHGAVIRYVEEAFAW